MAPKTRPPMGQEQASLLLRSLEAEHGPDVLAALLGAGLAQDVKASRREAEQDGEEPPEFDLGWLTDFAEHEAFVRTSGGVLARSYSDPSVPYEG